MDRAAEPEDRALQAGCRGPDYRVSSSDGPVGTEDRMRLFAIALVALAADPNYSREFEQYRAKREASLKKDDGWLTVVGLFRLKEGENRVGAGEPNEIVLP